ncbi:methyltransferase domain-containing protein [Brucella sp. IR073]|uniref:class I SAM-dependent methyltransferase n=1 Tax=unclassified Brucella TaxID=2632610 RepID=UPI003B9862D2
MNSIEEKVDFDDYVEKYEQLLSNQLSFFEKERDYFSSYKIELCARLMQKKPASILDFGCGIGLSLPELQRTFAGSTIYASDISEKSVLEVTRRNPAVHALTNGALEAYRFDLIYVATVIHHVAPPERPALFQRLRQLLKPGGQLCIFEHNPWNPVTQRMVADCPFDTDAVLVSLPALKRALHDAGFRHFTAGYSLFFPGFIKALRPLENWMRWLPLGGQYYVVAH